MHTVTVTSLYAAVLALFFVFLSLRVIRQRRTNHIGFGDGGNPPLLRAMRAHGNFAEYAPFALLLMLVAELQGSAVWSLHVLGLLLLVGRILHAIGVSRDPGWMPGRVVGMVLTFFALIFGAATNLLMLATRA